MKKIQLILLITASFFLLSGCLTSGIDITVNKDGSGEIIQTFMVIKEYMAFMGLGEENSDPNMINKVELKKLAAAMGDGVSLSKVKPAEEDSLYSGYKAYFTFSDISKIRISITPATTPGTSEGDDMNWITFDFEKGRNPVLTIISQSDESDKEVDKHDSSEPEETDEGMKEQMKEIFKSIHFWFKVNVNGKISNTNASYTDGSVVTIIDMNFEKIVENDELFTVITSDKNSDLEDYKDQLEKIGVKIDDQDRIEIRF